MRWWFVLDGASKFRSFGLLQNFVLVECRVFLLKRSEMLLVRTAQGGFSKRKSYDLRSSLIFQQTSGFPWADSFLFSQSQIYRISLSALIFGHVSSRFYFWPLFVRTLSVVACSLQQPPLSLSSPSHPVCFLSLFVHLFFSVARFFVLFVSSRLSSDCILKPVCPVHTFLSRLDL